MSLKSFKFLVGARGFEPPTPSLPDVGASLISFSNSCQPIESLGFDPNKEIGSLVNRRCTHFVRFTSLSDQRFQNATLAFGPPDFLHRHWDQRARRDIADGDLVVFAKGDADQPVVPFNGNDEVYA